MEHQTLNVQLQSKFQILNSKFQSDIEYSKMYNIMKAEEIINILSNILKKSGITKMR